MIRAENIRNILLENAMSKLEKYLADKREDEECEIKFKQLLIEKANCCS